MNKGDKRWEMKLTQVSPIQNGARLHQVLSAASAGNRLRLRRTVGGVVDVAHVLLQEGGEGGGRHGVFAAFAAELVDGSVNGNDFLGGDGSEEVKPVDVLRERPC